MRLFPAIGVVVAAAGGLWAGRFMEKRGGAQTAPLETRLRQAQEEADRLRRELSLLRAGTAERGSPPAASVPAVPVPSVGDPLEKLRDALARGEVDPFVERFLEAMEASHSVLLENFLREPSGKLPPAVAEALLRALDSRVRAALAKPGANPMGEARLIARVGGPGAVDTLWKAVEERTAWGFDLAFELAGIDGAAAREFILKKIEEPQDRRVRDALLVGLGRRADAQGDLMRLMEEGGIVPQNAHDWNPILSGLVQRCQADPSEKDRLWEAALSMPPEARILFRTALIRVGDPRVQDWLLDEIRAGRTDAMPLQTWFYLSRDRLTDGKDAFLEIASDPARAFETRSSAALAAARADPEGAARAILVDYERMPEAERARVAHALRLQGTREAAVWLARIVDSDPSEAVRHVAR